MTLTLANHVHISYLFLNSMQRWCFIIDKRIILSTFAYETKETRNQVKRKYKT